MAFLQQLYYRIKAHDSQSLAAEMSYNLIGSIIPACIFLVSLFGLIGRETDMYPLAFETIERFTPPNTSAFLEEVLQVIFTESSGSLTILGFLVTLWSAGGGASILIKSMQRAIGTAGEKKPFWYVPLLSLVIVLSLGLMAILSVNLILFGDTLLEKLQAFFQLPGDQAALLNSLRWGMTVLGILLFTMFVYALLLYPKKHRFDWQGVFPGALVFVLLWISLSLLFRLYVNYVNQLNIFYGTLGTFVIFVTWLYYSSLAIILGTEVTALFALKEPDYRKP